MTWFKVDDGFHDHPKVLGLQSRKGWQGALALWTLAGAWSSKHLTDGFVPSASVARLGCAKRDAEMLVEAGLWLAVDGGYAFHEWEARNPTRKDVEAKREKTREKVSEWRRNKTRNQVTGEVSNPAPDPTRPDPTNSSLRSEGERVRALPQGEPENLAQSGLQPTVDVLGLQLALGAAADELGWETAPEVMPAQLSRAAKRVLSLAKARGVGRDEAARLLAKAALLRARATGQGVGFALLEVDPANPVPVRAGRGGKPRMAPATTHEDFADAEPLEVQLARLGAQGRG